jgi:membrane-bound lytic murein transglycosylase B
VTESTVPVVVDEVGGSIGRVARVALGVLLVSLLVGIGGGAVWLLGLLGSGTTAAAASPAADVAAAPVQLNGAAPNAASASDLGVLAGWAAKVSATTGIPAPAVQAYGAAELALRRSTPGCHLAWNTLAGIGRVESNHGQFGGAQLRADGTESKPIIGVPLDGSPGVQNIPDTDHGVLDGDPVYDHAVGPMQFLPSTWWQYADAGANPQNVDAAALAAGRYLCVGGRDLATPQGWWAGVLSYNNSLDYAQKVFGLADNYARAGG